MKNILLLFFALIPMLSNSQSLGADRIENINKSVVRILIDSVPSGTGFFVHKDGWVATCHHVIESAYIRDSLTNGLVGLKKIQIEFQNGEIVETGIMTYLLNDGYKNSFSYDYSLLKVQTEPKTNYRVLKIGKWSDVNDGDEIYSCGYPLGIKQRFISKGILSTKWSDTIPLF
ncbi:MAG TPA: serine protease, partial [Draconibacterium sp.]|nr:serine protease [Draconibacterium sp.]